MTSPTHDRRPYDGDRIAAICEAVEPHDFERIDPPPVVWNAIVAEFEVEVAAQEAAARRRARRRPSWVPSTRILAVAAALIVLAGASVAALVWPDDPPSRQELAMATMTDDGLPVTTDATASARVVCAEGGAECRLDLDLSEVPDAGDADLELWVINADVTDMHSLGLVTDSGEFALPAGVDVADFPIVDLSIEPRDGVAAHSGQSVLRGVFTSS